MRLNVSLSDLGKAVKVGRNIYVIKTLVAIGGGKGHLTHSGLRKRFLQNLENGRDEKILQEDHHTSREMLNEEVRYVQAVHDEDINSFNLDTTTTIIKLNDGSLVLHSPGEATDGLVAEVSKLGSKVTAIIAPNLQHWLGCPSWISLFPEAMVYVAPAAEGECLLQKLSLENCTRATVLDERGSLFDGQVSYRLLKGAPLMLNEVLFFHASSSTLIVADAFYTGYCCSHYIQKDINTRAELVGRGNPPNVFTRVWFKMTKDHWCSSQLPSYRTDRVLSNGEPEIVISCLRNLIKDWAPLKMICAHGDRVIENDPGEALISAWSKGVITKSETVCISA